MVEPIRCKYGLCSSKLYDHVSLGLKESIGMYIGLGWTEFDLTRLDFNKLSLSSNQQLYDQNRIKLTQSFMS